MVTLLFTSILVLGFIAVALYFWQKPARRTLDRFESEKNALPHSDARGLFIGAGANEIASAVELKIDPDAALAELIARAKIGDRSVLQDASNHSDEGLYEQVLNCLLEDVDSEPKLLSLVSYVVGNDLRVSKRLAATVIEAWRHAPDRPSTAKMLHIAALSDDVETYQVAVNTALKLWREGQLSSVSPIELRSLFDSEFWVLSSATRNTGAGFLLKRTLASARRELESAARLNQ